MAAVRRALAAWHGHGRHRRAALALGGGGVIGGMYEVGALAALERRLGRCAARFDLYVGCSAGAVVASLLANGVPATELYRILDEDRDDPLNFRRSAVFGPDAGRHAVGCLGRLLWALGRRALGARRGAVPDLLARAEGALPAGFFPLDPLERFLRTAFAARGLANAFPELPAPLLVPAVDLDAAERVVFGLAPLAEVPVSQAVAASSAIPGFFEPYPIGGRAYVDGGVGFSGHADLAVEAGATLVLIVHPLVPTRFEPADGGARTRGFWTILEQTSRIYGDNLLRLGLASVRARHPEVRCWLLEPPRTGTPLFGPSMGFEASRAALRFGYTSTLAWLDQAGAGLGRALAAARP